MIAFLKAIKKNKESLDLDSESKMLCKDGGYLDILWSNYLMYDENGVPEFVVSIGMNIIKHKLVNENLIVSQERFRVVTEETNCELWDIVGTAIHKIIYYDKLTGLPNKTSIDNLMAKKILNAERKRNKVALFYIDLDNFKSVNDILGPPGGNQL